MLLLISDQCNQATKTKRTLYSQYDFDRARFPSADQRRRFLSSYLKQFHKLNHIEATEREFTAELDDLFHEANLSALLFLGRMVMVGGLFDQNPNVSAGFTSEFRRVASDELRRTKPIC